MNPSSTRPLARAIDSWVAVTTSLIFLHRAANQEGVLHRRVDLNTSLGRMVAGPAKHLAPVRLHRVIRDRVGLCPSGHLQRPTKDRLDLPVEDGYRCAVYWWIASRLCHMAPLISMIRQYPPDGDKGNPLVLPEEP